VGFFIPYSVSLALSRRVFYKNFCLLRKARGLDTRRVLQKQTALIILHINHIIFMENLCLSRK
jgi:hypothetical protein